MCDNFLTSGTHNLDKEPPSFFCQSLIFRCENLRNGRQCRLLGASSPLFRMRQLRLVLHCRNDGYLETIGRRGRANIKQSKAKIQQCVSILRERVKAKLTSAPATRAFNSNKLKRVSSTNLWADKYFQFCSKKLEENIGHSFCCFSLYQKPP